MERSSVRRCLQGKDDPWWLLERREWRLPEDLPFGDDRIVPLAAGELLGWKLVADRPDDAGGSGSTWLHVCAGLGTSPYAPVRFACRPEATLLTLVAADAASG